VPNAAGRTRSAQVDAARAPPRSNYLFGPETVRVVVVPSIA
jgi:hypothetical protein